MSPEPAAPSHRSRAACLCGRRQPYPRTASDRDHRRRLARVRALISADTVERSTGPVIRIRPPVASSISITLAQTGAVVDTASAPAAIATGENAEADGAGHRAHAASETTGWDQCQPLGLPRCNRARLDRRRNDPLLLRPRPAPAALHRRDHLDFCLRHRTIPRINPMTSSLDPICARRPSPGRYGSKRHPREHVIRRHGSNAATRWSNRRGRSSVGPLKPGAAARLRHLSRSARRRRLIPSPIDQNSCTHWRDPRFRYKLSVEDIRSPIIQYSAQPGTGRRRGLLRHAAPVSRCDLDHLNAHRQTSR